MILEMNMVIIPPHHGGFVGNRESGIIAGKSQGNRKVIAALTTIAICDYGPRGSIMSGYSQHPPLTNPTIKKPRLHFSDFLTFSGPQKSKIDVAKIRNQAFHGNLCFVNGACGL